MIVDDKKEYLLQASVIEARHLKPKDAGMSNPMVVITCGNLQQQATECIQANLSPCWNQAFTFAGMQLTDTELQNAELKFEVFSKNRFKQNDLIGQFSVGLSTLYNNSNHEYYQVWLILLNPDEEPDEAQGYLLVNCFIVGPGDRPPVHDANDAQNQDGDDDEDVNIDAMTFEELRAYQEKKQGIIVLGKPMVARKAFQLSCYVFKADQLCPIGGLGDDGKPTLFVSARAIGLVQRTKPIGGTVAPVFNEKMLFPCYFPFLNDKIILRAWHASKTGPDEFFGNLPEVPSPNDYFNISKLVSLGGRIPAKWINLYSIPPKERNKLGKKKKHPREGTYFMGRILISFAVLANEKPKVATVPTNPFYDPETQAYRLFCDIYEVKYLKEDQIDILVWCDCRIGAYTTGDNFRKKPIKLRAAWEVGEKINQIALPEILEYFPKDLSTVPDIFLNLYTGTDTGQGSRIGYIRLNSSDVITWDGTPRWLHFKPIDMNLDSPGSILVNLQFMIDHDSIKRIFKQKGITKKYVLHWYIVQGFELDPKNDDPNIKTEVVIGLDNKSAVTKGKEGRFPFWNEANNFEVEVDWKLDFAPDITISCNKIKKGGFFNRDKEEREELGRFTIPIRCVKREGKKYPHYFNLIKSNEITGRLMAMFYIEQKKKKDKNGSSFSFQLYQELKKEIKADVNIFVFGVRELPFKPKFEKVEFDAKLFLNDNSYQSPGSTKDNKETLEITKINDETTAKDVVNIIKKFEFNDITVHGEEFLIFPFCKLTFIQRGFFMDEERFLFFNLSECCPDVPENIKKLHRLLFEVNLGVTKLDQDQVFIPVFEKSKDKKVGSDDEEEDDGSDEEAKKAREEKEKKELEEQEKRERAYELSGERTMINKIQKYKNMVISELLSLECKNKDKMQEKEVKKQLRKKYLKEMREMNKQELVSKEQTDRLKDIQDQYRQLKMPQMYEAMFYGFEDIGDAFDYGREVYKEDVYETHPLMEIPYKKVNLQEIPKNIFSDKFQMMNGYYKLGKACQSFIKYNVDVKLKGYVNKSLDALVPTTNQPAAPATPGPLNDEDLEESIKKELKNYNIFNNLYLKKLRNLYLIPEEKKKLPNAKQEIVVNMSNCKVRVYIYRCLNLTAQDNGISIIESMAGYAAYCKANAYLELWVGDNYNNEGSPDSQKGLKYVCDKQNFVPNSLSPDFFKYYELEADLPTEWKLTINVKSFVEGSLSDTLIGTNIVDLEDRFVGEQRTRTLMKFKAMETDYKQILRELEKKMETETEENDTLRNEINEISRKVGSIKSQIDQLKSAQVPVEFRQLDKAGSKTAQGIIEMFVEVWPKDIAKKMKPAKIEQPPPQEFELRLIIWQTRDIPLGRKKSLCVFINVLFDPEGWLSPEKIKKETDCHMGCKDGNAIYNWRMKFPITLPCTFPRLYFCVYDFNAFGANDCLGVCYISLKRVFKRLLKEGRLVFDKKWLPLSSTEDPGESKGEIEYSVYLIQKYDADQNPVGESWDEPNRDPKLEKPKVGRGIGDFLGGFSFDFSFNFDLFGNLKCMIMVFMAFMTICVLFIAPGILVK